MKQELIRPYMVRLGIVMAISIAAAFIFNEITYVTQKDLTDRAPHTVQLVIPAGTAALVKEGRNPASIPPELVFVKGDTLQVVNKDSVPHQLGPIWVPPGSTGKLVMDKVDKLAYSCSFQTTQYLGLDVHPPTTIGTRVIALSFTAPTVATLLFLYSLLVFPIKMPVPKNSRAGAA